MDGAPTSGEASSGPSAPRVVASPSRSRASSLVRKALAAPAPRETCVPYRLADFEIDLGVREFYEVPVEDVSDWLAEVVAVESPVHWEEAGARVVRFAGLGRMGSRIKERVSQALGQCIGGGAVAANGDFLWVPDRQWRPGEPQARVRCRKDVHDSLRRIDRIAPEEIGHALVLAVRDSHGIKDDDAVGEAARIFGFKQLGKNLRTGFHAVLGRLVEEGTLQRQSGFLYEAEGSAGDRSS